jgi:hypothetical protein
MKENATIAAVYNNKSIAEQNSLDIGTSTQPCQKILNGVPTRRFLCLTPIRCSLSLQLGSC